MTENCKIQPELSPTPWWCPWTSLNSSFAVTINWSMKTWKQKSSTLFWPNTLNPQPINHANASTLTEDVQKEQHAWSKTISHLTPSTHPASLSVDSEWARSCFFLYALNYVTTIPTGFKSQWVFLCFFCMRFQKLIQRQSATGKLGLSTLQKVTETLCQLAIGRAADSVDEYLRIGKTKLLVTLKTSMQYMALNFSDLQDQMNSRES